ncbi:MAG: 16S rRNA (adenine(1518)-N(6)/adenine(1519)-N(6))-dimethyltransferase [Hyphomicrobiales bacterium]|nr:MAG: 16S rRNA (adenine(1518)-N(6)/adenine(1519)-N(6))-dimethyltransferase [Hyphomicrobiales bacterium]
MSDALPPLGEVIRAHGLRARKSLGQNFLLDLNLTGRIARAAGDLTGHDILEIGPGPGGLTRALLAHGARHVTAIERDERCIAALAEIAEAYPDKLTVLTGDALSTDPVPHLTKPARIVANLPYNIATPLLIGWLQAEPWPPWFASMTLMFQREVALRISAAPGSKHYGRLAVMAGWRTEAKICFDVNPSAFTPPPKVVSTVVHLTPRANPLPCRARALERVTAAAFGQRRKMLRASLKSLFHEPQPVLEELGIAPTIRAEQLDIAGFCALARRLDGS